MANISEVILTAMLVDHMSGGSAARAEAAAQAAEASAATAASHNYGITVDGTTLKITEAEEQEG